MYRAADGARVGPRASGCGDGRAEASELRTVPVPAPRASCARTLAGRSALACRNHGRRSEPSAPRLLGLHTRRGQGCAHDSKLVICGKTWCRALRTQGYPRAHSASVGRARRPISACRAVRSCGASGWRNGEISGAGWFSSSVTPPEPKPSFSVPPYGSPPGAWRGRERRASRTYAVGGVHMRCPLCAHL
jgi:hypothetical protein